MSAVYEVSSYEPVPKTSHSPFPVLPLFVPELCLKLAFEGERLFSLLPLAVDAHKCAQVTDAVNPHR